MREAAEGEEKESRSPHSSEADGEGLAAFMRGRRYCGELRHDQSEAEGEEDMDDGEPKHVRKYFWTRYVDSGFPNQVRGVCVMRIMSV